MRGVTAECGAAFPPRRFQLTRLMRGVTAPPPRSAHCWIFQLTRLMRGVTTQKCCILWLRKISTHTPHARRDIYSSSAQAGYTRISTHTPHARRDEGASYGLVVPRHFNSHASCEAWQICFETSVGLGLFQLTRLMRGVTMIGGHSGGTVTHFNSHASCEAWPVEKQMQQTATRFQLTRLMRGVTQKTMKIAREQQISTHTPHARRDRRRLCQGMGTKDFNSHASCEAWLGRTRKLVLHIRFQLTRLMRGVTEKFTQVEFGNSNFNSHASCEAWPQTGNFYNPATTISTHTPHARRDNVFLCG